MRHRAYLVAMTFVILLLLCGGAGYWFTHAFKTSWAYEFEARFEALPPNDKALKAWIQEQPGVVRNCVHIGRFDQDKKRLAVLFIQVRNLAGSPSIPDLDAACKNLKYVNPDAPFRDSKENRGFTED
jgi:hypothetical protein